MPALLLKIVEVGRMSDLVISDDVVVESGIARFLLISKSLNTTLGVILKKTNGRIDDEVAELYAKIFKNHVKIAKDVAGHLGTDFYASLSLTSEVLAAHLDGPSFDSLVVQEQVEVVVAAAQAVLDEGFDFRADMEVEDYVNSSFSRTSAKLVRSANKIVELHRVLPMGIEREFALEFSLATIASIAEEKSAFFSDELNEEERILSFENLIESVSELYLSSWGDIGVCLLNPSGHVLSKGDVIEQLSLFREIVRDYPLGHVDRQDEVVTAVAEFIYDYAAGDTLARVGPLTDGQAQRMITPVAIESMLPLAQSAWDRVLTRIYQDVMTKDEQQLRDWLKGDGSKSVELGVVFKEVEILYEARPKVENEVVMDLHVVESEVRDRFNLISQAVSSVLTQVGPWGRQEGA